ncbi:MAG: hypothetical protein OXI38_10965 [Bacteroidota bacterium]|nr:hypothetical protein [Bacteroidota bacterium]
MKFQTLLTCTLALGLLPLLAIAQEEETEEEVVIELNEEAAETLVITAPVLDSLMVGGDVHIERDGNTIVVTGRREGGDRRVRYIERHLNERGRHRSNWPAIMPRRDGRGAYGVLSRIFELEGDSLVILKNDGTGTQKIWVMPHQESDRRDVRVENRGDSMTVIIREPSRGRTSGVDRDRRRGRTEVRIRRAQDGRSAYRVSGRIFEFEGDSLVALNNDSTGVQKIRVLPYREPYSRDVRVENQGDSMIVVIGEPSRRRISGVDRDRRRGRPEVRIRRAQDGTRPHVRIQRRPRHQPSAEAAEIARMEARARTLAEAARTASDDDRAEHEAALRAYLAEFFDRKLRMEERRLDRERERLGQQETTLSDRRANRDRIIDDRLNQLLGRGSVYRW